MTAGHVLTGGFGALAHLLRQPLLIPFVGNFGDSDQAETGGRARDATPRQEDIDADQ